MKIAFIITRKRNNVVVLFETPKVQSFLLTEVRDCESLIVITSSTFLKRKHILKEKRQHQHVLPHGTRSVAWAIFGHFPRFLGDFCIMAHLWANMEKSPSALDQF